LFSGNPQEAFAAGVFPRVALSQVGGVLLAHCTTVVRPQ
jgi:hypothetical protein